MYLTAIFIAYYHKVNFGDQVRITFKKSAVKIIKIKITEVS